MIINEMWWVLLLVLNFGAIMLAYRLWGKLGLYIWIPISVIVANIQVTKNVNLFGLEATLGNIVYSTSFLATDILSEAYGPKASKRAISIGFFALITMTVFMQIALMFTPAQSDMVQSSLEMIFGFMPRIALGSLVAYLVSNMHDIYAFEFWKKKKPGKRTLWMRNCFSTMISQLLDSIIFTFIAFWGVYSFDVWLQIVITTYVLKWIVALCDTPFMYLARHWMDNGTVEVEREE